MQFSYRKTIVPLPVKIIEHFSRIQQSTSKYIEIGQIIPTKIYISKNVLFIWIRIYSINKNCDSS